MAVGVLSPMTVTLDSFIDDEIEYLEFENLIQEVADRLDAQWSYSLEEEAYQIEFIDPEGNLQEAVSVSTDFCTEGFNEGRDLLTCRILLKAISEDHYPILPELLQLAEQLVFTKMSLTPDHKLYLTGKALYHQELASDVVTTMVEEMSTLASEFRLKLESIAD